MKLLSKKSISVAIAVFVAAVLGIFFVIKQNFSGQRALNKQLSEHINTYTKSDYQAVVFEDDSFAGLKGLTNNDAEFINHNSQEIEEVKNKLEQKNFVVMWEMDPEYRIPHFTGKYKIFFPNHELFLYPPFEKESGKKFFWQKNHHRKVQFYYFKITNLDNVYSDKDNKDAAPKEKAAE